MEPRSDPHDRAKIKFADLVAEQICAASKADEFHELVLVAPAHVLAELQDKLDSTTRAKLTGTLAKDLVHVPNHDLWPHLKEWVRPTHRA